MFFGWYPFQIVHLKEAATYLNGLNGRKNGKDGHLDGHLDGHFERWKNETFRLDGHLDGHFFYFWKHFYMNTLFRTLFSFVYKLLQGVNNIS